MNDLMEAVKNYLSAGNELLRGKRLFVYFCFILIALIGLIPAGIKLALDPDIKTVMPSVAKSVYELSEPYIETNEKPETEDTGFKSDGQILAEKLEAEREASHKAEMKYLGILIDWIYTFTIGGILTVGMDSIYLRMSKREVGIKDLFSGFTSGNYLNKVLALVLKQGIIYGIAAIEAVFMLLIPGLGLVGLGIMVLGLIVTYSLFMVEFILADDPNISFIRAIQISFKASRGYRLTLLCIDFLTSFLPQVICSFVAIFATLKGLIDGDPSMIFLAYAAVIALCLFMIIIKPIKEGAFAAAYEDAKMNGKSYGIISQFEFFDPEDEIDNTDDSGMIFFG